MDLGKLFILDVPILELLIRGSAIYLGIFVILRVMLRREAGSLGTSDVLMIVLIADAAQNGMTGNYNSISAGLLLVAVIVGWDFIIDFAAYKFPLMEKLLRPKALLLIKNGRIIKESLKTEMVTRKELSGLLRENGISDISEVSKAFIESDGKLSVIKRG